jgi:hypothetical protein
MAEEEAALIERTTRNLSYLTSRSKELSSNAWMSFLGLTKLQSGGQMRLTTIRFAQFYSLCRIQSLP